MSTGSTNISMVLANSEALKRLFADVSNLKLTAPFFTYIPYDIRRWRRRTKMEEDDEEERRGEKREKVMRCTKN